MSTPRIRASQRAPKSCISCTRRKAKCDKVIPCLPCLRRGEPQLCAREIVRVRGRLLNEPESSDAQDVHSLQRRIVQLEADLLRARDASHHNDHGAVSSGQSLGQSNVNTPRLDGIEESLEDINFGGALKDTRTGVEPFPNMWFAERDEKLLLLPPDSESSWQIVEFSLSRIGWLHCAIRLDVFRQEHEVFWSAIRHGDHSILRQHRWMAVYLAILAGGGLFGAESDVEMDFLGLRAGNNPPLDNNSVVRTSRVWYEGALRELNQADFLKEANLQSIQAICVLSLCNGNFGQTERERLLNGIAITMARSLGMHKLGKESSYSAGLGKQTEWSTPEGRALGRRLWWTLVICDWLGPLSSPASITPNSFDCALEPSPFDWQIVSSGDRSDEYSISPLDYHIAMRKLARLNYLCIKSDQDEVLNRTQQALEEITMVMRTLPFHLRADTNSIELTLPPWALFQRYLIACTVQFMRLSLAQRSFSDWLKPQSKWTGLRRVSIDAAHAITLQIQGSTRSVFRRSWISVSATLAAGVFLAFHEICFRGAPEERDHAISAATACLEILESIQDYSLVAQQGRKVLSKLLRMVNEVRMSLTILPPEAVVSALSSESDPVEATSDFMDPLPALPDGNWNLMSLASWPFGNELGGQMIVGDWLDFDSSAAENVLQGSHNWL